MGSHLRACGSLYRAPEHVVTPEMQIAAEQLQQLQQRLMHQQAELGARRADVLVGGAALRCAMMCPALLCCAVHHDIEPASCASHAVPCYDSTKLRLLYYAWRQLWHIFVA